MNIQNSPQFGRVSFGDAGAAAPQAQAVDPAAQAAGGVPAGGAQAAGPSDAELEAMLAQIMGGAGGQAGAAPAGDSFQSSAAPQGQDPAAAAGGLDQAAAAQQPQAAAPQGGAPTASGIQWGPNGSVIQA